MSLRANLTDAIGRAQQQVRDQGMDTRMYALTVGLHAADVVGARPYRVDSAELIGFIRNNDPTRDAAPDDLAEAIIHRFNLES